MDKKEFEQRTHEIGETEYMYMPVAAYMFEAEARERKEHRLYNIIIALVAAIIVIVGIFLLYLNQFDVVSEDYIQEVSGDNNQDMFIEDGIHRNDIPKE